MHIMAPRSHNMKALNECVCKNLDHKGGFLLLHVGVQ